MSQKIRARFLSLIGLLALISTAASGQIPLPPASRPVYVIIEARVRDPLIKSWNDSSIYQHERGYCVFARAGVLMMGFPKQTVGLIVSLDSLAKPDSILLATPISISFFCPPTTIPLHTHVPTTCQRSLNEHDPNVGACVLGGDEAWECFPSQSDWEALIQQDRKAGVIQCDKHALIVFVNPKYMEEMFNGTAKHE